VIPSSLGYLLCPGGLGPSSNWWRSAGLTWRLRCPASFSSRLGEGGGRSSVLSSPPRTELTPPSPSTFSLVVQSHPPREGGTGTRFLRDRVPFPSLQIEIQGDPPLFSLSEASLPSDPSRVTFFSGTPVFLLRRSGTRAFRPFLPLFHKKEPNFLFSSRNFLRFTPLRFSPTFTRARR